MSSNAASEEKVTGVLDIPCSSLSIHAQTVRRPISKGELPSQKEMTDFDEMWFIPASAVKAAIHTVEVVPLTRSAAPAEIGQIIDNAIAAQMKPLKEEIQSFQAELTRHFTQKEETAALEITNKEGKGTEELS